MIHGLIDPDASQLRGEQSAAVATLVSATGSTSKKIGAKMIVGRSGRLLGGVTIGGCVDAQVIEAAESLIAEGGRRLLSISLDDDEAWEIGLTCAGSVEVLIEQVNPADPNDPVMAAHRRAAQLVDAGETAVIVTPLEGTSAPYAVPESEAPGAGSSARVFVDRVAPPMTLAIVGAGQVAMSLTNLARELELRTVIIDGRERYAARERFPLADEIHVGMPSEIVASMTANKNVAIVLVSHDYKYELPILRHVLRQPFGYVGMLGSRKRGTAVRELLSAEGFTDDELARIRTPIGLDIGGKASSEVALSILAEIIAVKNGRR